MMQVSRIFLFIFFVLASAAPLLAWDGGTTIRVEIEDRAQLERLTRLVSIDRVDGLQVQAVASPTQLVLLAEAGYRFEVIDDGRQPELATMCATGWVDNDDREYNCYPTYDQYVAFMQRFATNYPNLCQLINLGPTTNTSRPHALWVMAISDNPGIEEDEPEILYTSSMHGDETTGFVLMLQLIDELLSGHGSDMELTALVDEHEIWINPAANPDGTYYGSDSDLSSAIRYVTTSSGGNSYVDPNRNFPDPEDGPHPDGEVWWLETRTMMDFAAAHSFVLSANFHGGVEVLNYPWDTWQRRHADDYWLIDVSRAYAEQAQADAGQNGYLTDFNDGITNGYDWYTVAGGRQDFMTYFYGSREITMEISATKLLPASQLPAHWTYNRQALLDYIKQTDEGIRGVVTDADTGLPVHATVEVVGYDVLEDNSMVLTDPEVGDYHRMLLQGTYTLRFSALGYATEEVVGISVGDDVPATIVNVQLVPVLAAEVIGQVTTPGLRAAAIEGASVEILSTAQVATTGSDGTYSLSGVYEGDYSFRVSAAGYESYTVTRTVTVPITTLNFGLAPVSVAGGSDFELDGGGLSGSGDWQWGEPTGGGNPGAHSGTRVWATTLAGNYSDGSNSNLDLSALTLPSDGPQMRFWHYYDIEDGTNDWDGGNVSVRPAGSGAYTVLEPVAGYPSSDVDALGEPGFTGTLSGWEEVVIDLSTYAGQSVDLRWHFASDSSVNQLGWYVDDLSIMGAASHVADFEVTPPAPAAGESVSFVDRSTGPVSSWLWLFGDGSSSTEQNPVHSYASGGTYTVTLEVTLPEGTVLVSRPLTVGGADIFIDGFESGDTSAWSGVGD